MKKIIVLAGNYKEFEEYLASNGLHTGNTIYGDYNHMAGIEASKVVTTGSFYERKDARQAEEFALSRIRD